MKANRCWEGSGYGSAKKTGSVRIRNTAVREKHTHKISIHAGLFVMESHLSATATSDP